VIQPTTVFMTLKELPVVGNFRVGNQQNWIGQEHIESARFLDFMERSPNMDLFYGPNNNGYAPGISIFNSTPDQNATLQLGAYKNNLYDSGFTYNIGDAWVYGGRGIWTPYYDEESKGRNLVHMGFGTEYRTYNTDLPANQAGQNIRLRSRGDLRNAASTLDPNYLDTGNFFTTGQLLIAPELVAQYGPWLFRSEYAASWFYDARPTQTSATSLGSVFFQGGYISALYFFTGENRTYVRQSGVFARTLPNENFNFNKRTWGAWQGGIRFDWQDLNYGKFVNGGNCQDLTFGLNWFLNPNARFQFNYVMSWLNNGPAVTFPGTVGALNGARFVGDGTINSFGGRMDFTF
jgi:phosphate-selective porin OprO/OprP